MLKRLLAILLLLCWLPSVAMAMEDMYYVTEQQLKMLETNIEVLESDNSKLQKDLRKLKEQSKNQEESLRTANESFEKYAASQQAKLRRTKAERNALLVLLSGAVVSLAVKK